MVTLPGISDSKRFSNLSNTVFDLTALAGFRVQGVDEQKKLKDTTQKALTAAAPSILAWKNSFSTARHESENLIEARKAYENYLINKGYAKYVPENDAPYDIVSVFTITNQADADKDDTAKALKIVIEDADRAAKAAWEKTSGPMGEVDELIKKTFEDAGYSTELAGLKSSTHLTEEQKLNVAAHGADGKVINNCAYYVIEALSSKIYHYEVLQNRGSAGDNDESFRIQMAAAYNLNKPLSEK
jgi:hypothetical protein